MSSNNLVIPNIRLFIFGTLREGSRLDYYMQGSSPHGIYYTRGQLMESAKGSAYIDNSIKDTATIGELHHINYYFLRRIHHLENASGEFPKSYEITLVPIWNYPEDGKFTFSKDTQSYAFCYKRKSDTKVMSGDWIKRKVVLDEIERLLKIENSKTLYHNDIINHILEYLKGTDHLRL